MTNFKMTIRVDCAVSACNPLPLLIKKKEKKTTLVHWLSVSGIGLWMRVCPSRRESDLPIWPSYSEVANLWNKANFPFHQLCLFIGFRSVRNQIPLLVIWWLQRKKLRVVAWSIQWQSLRCFVLSHSVMYDSLWPHGLLPASPWGFSRQEYWSGLPSSLLRDLLNPGIKPRFPALQAILLPSEPPGTPKEMF